MNEVRIPPYSLESEQSLLGGLMLENKSWDNIADILSKDDFYRSEHKIIFSAISDLIEHDKPADILTVREYLSNDSKIANTSSFEYLVKISTNTPSIANIKVYAAQVREMSIKRSLLDSARAIADKVYKKDGSHYNDILDFAEKEIFHIAENLVNSDEHSIYIKDAIKEVVNKIQKIQDGGLPAVKTGFKEIDKITSGLHEGDLIIIAGRPSMGKTALAMNIVENIAIHASDKKPVAIFSLEMSYEQIVMRMISSCGKIDAQKIRVGNLDDEDWDKITKATDSFDGSNIIIDETPSITPIQIRAKCRRIKRQHKDLALIVIDYLQLMGVGSNVENRVQEISLISRALKSLARELKVPIIALSQLNRSVESRAKTSKGRIPQMSDLRDSGAIEQDADIVAFIYRDEVYHDSEYKGEEELNKADIKIAKHRNGPIGTAKLGFQKEYAKFINLPSNVDLLMQPSNYETDIADEHNKYNFDDDDYSGLENVIDGTLTDTDNFDPNL